MNNVDCGVFVLWDIYSLSSYGTLLTRSPEEISNWRSTLYVHIQSLGAYKGRRHSKREMYTGAVIDLDSD
jgi:hypothetical protein